LTPSITYFICTLPRSGSWLLAESLEQTELAGRPREYFARKFLSEEEEASGYANTLTRIIEQGTTSNGVFGVKFHWHQFEFAPEVIWPGADGEIPVAVLLEEQFANLRYVWLTRRNKARQALSYYRASVTGQWWDIPGVDPESSLSPPAEFDFDQIRHMEDMLLDHEAKWQKYFEENDIDPLVLIYEEFAHDHTIAVREVFSHLGISYPERMDIRPRLLRQSDELTERWLDRYLALKRREMTCCARGEQSTGIKPS